MWREGDGSPSCSFIITAACQSFIISFTLSPFSSKVLRQDCNHSLQRSQHRPVDHHWLVQLAIPAEMERKLEVIDKSIITLRGESCCCECFCTFLQKIVITSIMTDSWLFFQDPKLAEVFKKRKSHNVTWGNQILQHIAKRSPSKS